MPAIQIGISESISVYGTRARLDYIKSLILNAKFKRKRKMPEHYIDQLLYIAEFIPELKLRLRSIDAIYWLKRRILNAIADHQLYLEAQGFLLPLTEVWQSHISAFASIKLGLSDINNTTYKILHTLKMGSEPEHFSAISIKIPHNRWIAYSVQKDESLGVMYSPRCRNGLPISPYAVAIRTPEATALYRRFMDMIIFESIRMQLAAGYGLVCPWYGVSSEGKDAQDGNCCGRNAIIWQAYNLGVEVGLPPTKWIAPECRKPKTKNLHA
jgi:hypothetical protein